ncbi:LOW QUALITY PROTEIN: probable flavin-containing monoamine oxidase A [Centropristis striata]|uniref:LOW QUALITY PROTEIN: probable flavin-containing monoamine oxidase A n=1 Tax=Centropristis striata TaxID=184440 RepID=UPI0027E20DF7|nr:LOW QUALITY PROTEIN: probable flavin-containing monoamine oxidase A [Centropristis striata]
MTAEIWDVIIVGAGLSGLSAAHLLRKRNAGLKILILEGKDRVGGRTLSLEIPAANGVDCWDFGGQWVGSTQTHILELIKELGLETYPQFNVGKKVHHIGGPAAKVRTYRSSIPALSPVVLMDLTQLLWKIDRLCATVCIQDPSRTPNAVQLDSMTLHSYIEQHSWTAELKDEIGLCSRSVLGMEPSQMSFLFFLMYAAAAGGLLALLESSPGSAQELKIKGGTQQLSRCLAERVGWKNVRLGSAVTAIWQDSEWARVMTATNTSLCRAVIVTCPPHLAAKIDYQPALPSQREFLTQNMPVGHMIKFIITYQTAFWKVKGFSGEIVAGPSDECPFCVTFDATSPSGNAALVGFIAGQQASRWSSEEVGERRKAVFSSLVKYLGPEAESFIHYEEKDWAKEEYSGGCPVNVMAPGLLTYYHPSLRKPCGRIHWAGTETATLWCGYMSGAIQAGQRAALEVLAELCPMTLTQEEQDAVQQSQTVKDAAKQTPSSRLKHLSTSKAVVIATLAISAALLLAQNQNALLKVKTYLANVFSITRHNVFQV